MSVILLVVLASAGEKCLSVDQTRCIPQPKVCTIQVPCDPPKPKPSPKPKPAPKKEVKKEPCCSSHNITSVNTEVDNSVTNNVQQNVQQNVQVSVFTVLPVKESPVPAVQVGLRGALGTWACPGHVFGLAGLRLKFPKVGLGAEFNTQFQMGNQVQFLVYPVQGKVNWHLGMGALFPYKKFFSNRTIPRSWDFTVGTGIEVPLARWVSFTADLRTTFPNAFAVDDLAFRGLNGVYPNVPNVVGNAFMASQFQLGLMLHSW